MKWEYKVICPAINVQIEENLADRLNAWGEDGWEVVSAIPAKIDDADWVVVILKRAKE